MKVRGVLLLCFSLCTVFAHSQFDWKELPVSIAYFGDNGFHPGFKIGTRYTLTSKEKYKVRRFKGRQTKLGDKGKLKSYYVLSDIGMYNHPNNHTGLLWNVGIGAERMKMRKGGTLGATFEVGYLYRLYKFNTYELSANGDIETVGGAGHSALTFSLSPVFGRDWSVKHNWPLKWYLKPALQMVKYNHAWFPNAALNVGVIWQVNQSFNSKSSKS